MDFYQIREKELKDHSIELYPEFLGKRSKDLMVQGRAFYAIWDEERGLWSRDEYDVQRLVDEELYREAEKRTAATGMRYSVRSMLFFSNGTWRQFKQFLAHVSDNSKALDSKLTFTNTEVKKSDYVTRRLPYSLGNGPVPAWDELTSVLYSPEERAKIEWAIGAVVAGDAKRIQKFVVFYGSAGTGKSTILGIIEKLFEGYTTFFDGKALGSSNGNFATEAFKNNPLVAIQHDADLSKLEDNARLNSIISHELMPMNEKYKPLFYSRVDAFLFMGSNQPVKISDAKSGIIRRLIDIHPTGVTFGPKHYHQLLSQIEFELGAIAGRCLETYQLMGRNYFSGYKPTEMMFQTDVFYNFIEAYFDVFTAQDAVTLAQAYKLYKEFCADTGIEKPMPQYKMREELRNYFDEYKDRTELDGVVVRSLYKGFSANKYKIPEPKNPSGFKLVLDETDSLLDRELANCPAQLARANGSPKTAWGKVTTTLALIDSSELHWVKVPSNHIVIDFDLGDDNGHKALDRNLEAASHWPATYGELSKSGNGVHLHYTFAGDVESLAGEYAPGIEVKVYRGDAALRRLLTRCNSVPIASISSGLPVKKKENVLQTKTMSGEKALRELILRNLRKEVHPGTKPSVDFIKKILDDAYESGMVYDVTDMRSRITAFANRSTNQARDSLKVVTGMKFASEGVEKGDASVGERTKPVDDRIVFFDVEVYPNLFVICWKYQGADEMMVMINPSAHEVEALFKLKLVGFYCRRYDNHILYAASMGASIMDLFKLSQKLIVDGNRGATFGQAYNLSYADIWDFSSEKSSLKKFEIKLGILHMELDLPWDEPVPESQWKRVTEYCANDVRATEAVFEDRKGDFTARQILAEMSGLTVNDTTQAHTAKLIFQGDRTPQNEFNYPDLSKEFPGYTFELGKSSYKGEDPGEGGYVYAEPGVHRNVAVLDVVSMHPTTIEILDLFGKYTSNFSDLKKTRVAIKRGDFEGARSMLGGKLAPYLQDESTAEQLSYALKIVINTVYGLTSAKFNNPFRDLRNVDNIVAKRGALFMIDLKEYLQKAGYQVVHIKTDSVKIANADPMALAKVLAFGKKFGYDFEHEATYEKFALVNDAVYIAGESTVPWDDMTKPFPGYVWHATGAQFAHPFVFKSLFSGEEIHFDDYCEARSVNKGTMYLDKERGKDPLDRTKMRHIGKTGLFVPVKQDGGVLYRFHEDRFYAVAGTKGYLWVEADVAENQEFDIDIAYFEKLKRDAVAQIEQFEPFETFVKGG